MIDYQKIKEELHPFLVKAEHLRKKHLFYQKAFSIMVVAIILGFLLLPVITFFNNTGFSNWIANTMQGKSGEVVQLAMALYWLPFFIFMIGSYSYKNKFKAQEKEIMKVALNKMFPEFKYDPRKQITARQIEESKLLPSYFQIRKNKNQQIAYNMSFGTLTGKVGKTSIFMGNVNIINQGVYGPFLMYVPMFAHAYMVYNYIKPWFSKHHSTENLGSNFVGMFAVIDFNKNFKGHTVILPDLMEKRVGYLAKNLQTLNMTRGQLVSLEDPEFEKDFVVYGTDQIEARYILSTSLMQRITAFKSKIDKPIMLSFNKNKLYIGVQHPHGFISLNKNKSLIKSNIFELLHADISTATAIVEDLNLNTGIWKNESIAHSK